MLSNLKVTNVCLRSTFRAPFSLFNVNCYIILIKYHVSQWF